MRALKLLFALLAVVTLGAVQYAPSRAADATPAADKLRMLGDYSVALGRKFSCDANGDAMVTTIKRYTYILQFDDTESPAAQDVAKRSLTQGIDDIKQHKAECGPVQTDLHALDNQARANRPLMDAASHSVAAVAGAAVACNVPQAEVLPVLVSAMAYTGTDGDDYKDRMAEWGKEGVDEVKTSQIGCDAVKSVFGEVKSIFGP